MIIHMDLIKFEPKLIKLCNRPRIIVGEKPNKTRDNSKFSLVGNRTGDFVAEVIGERENIILTNVVNYLYEGKFDRKRHLDEGICDLIELIETYNPIKIITLGGIADEFASSLTKPDDCGFFRMPHPSYINRFLSSLRGDYIKMLQDELDK